MVTLIDKNLREYLKPPSESFVILIGASISPRVMYKTQRALTCSITLPKETVSRMFKDGHELSATAANTVTLKLMLND